MLHNAMTDTPRAHDDQEHAADEVVARYVALQAGETSASQRLDFMRWTAESPPRREAVEDLRRIDTDLDALRGHYAAEVATLARPAARPALRRAAGLAAACVAGLGLVFLATAGRTVTASGGLPAQVSLGDGSRVHLDAGASVDIPYAPWSRHVTVRGGDAVFDIVHDERRPFSVAVGRMAIRDLGTRFLVQTGRGGMTVSVYEGAVEIDPGTGTPSRLLSPGTAMTVSTDGEMRAAPLAGEAEATAWRQGRLIFDDTPLADVAERLSRYGGEKVVIGSPAIAGLRISGSFELANRAGLLRAIEATLPVTARRTGEQTVLIPAPAREVVPPRLMTR